MKATELRIGNKLQKDNGEIFTISRLDESEDVLVKEERGLLTLGYNLIGIPLTEEILLKCGFENKVNYFTLYISELETTEIERKKIDIWFFEQRTVAELCRSGVCFSMVTCNYLHQLQNLYFALTGQELEINL